MLYRSMKNYFFWEKGDLFVHFMDIAYEDVSIFCKASQERALKAPVVPPSMFKLSSNANF